MELTEKEGPTFLGRVNRRGAKTSINGGQEADGGQSGFCRVCLSI